MSRASDNYSYSWCPECKKWVPTSCMTAEYDPVDDTLVRMCTHCENTLLAGQPSTVEEDGFDWNKCVCSMSRMVGFDVHCVVSRDNLATVSSKWTT